MLSPSGYRLAKHDLGAKALADLRKELTMTPLNTMVVAQRPVRSGQPNPTSASFALFQEDEQALTVPKFFGLQRFGPPQRMTLPAPIPAPSIHFEGALRPEQDAPVQAFMSAARDPRRMGGIISLSCGQGKTVIALNIMSRIGEKTLIVVHKDFLLTQWRERIQQFLPRASIGTIKAKVVDVESKDIVIASVQSLSMKAYPESTFDGFGLLVVDECHRIGTEVFSRALLKRTFAVSLGLSATVVRKDGMTKAFVAFLGDVVYKGARREDVVRVVQTRFFDEDPAYSREEVIPSIGKPNMSRMVNNICGFEPRNALILNRICGVLESEPGRKVLVLSDRKAQLAWLKEALTGRRVTSGFYYGGLKAAELAESEAKQVLLATFAYAAEGMDCRGLDTLVLASPKSDIEQSCGRILREQAHTRARTPLIIDVVDCFSLFERQALKRRRYYTKNGYTVACDSNGAPPAGESSDDDDDGKDATLTVEGGCRPRKEVAYAFR